MDADDMKWFKDMSLLIIGFLALGLFFFGPYLLGALLDEEYAVPILLITGAWFPVLGQIVQPIIICYTIKYLFISVLLVCDLIYRAMTYCFKSR